MNSARIKQFILFALIFMILDLIWIGLIMHDYYLESMGSLLRTYQGQMVINLPAALGAYVLIALAPVLFIFSRSNASTPPKWFAQQGALLGLVIYGIYDLTNMSLLDEWSWTLTVVDMLWGVCIYALATTATGIISRSWL